MTNTVKWDDPWSPANNSFDKVVSPAVDGYTPDKDGIDTKEQKAEENPVVKSNETARPAQSLAVENKVPTGLVNVVYNDNQVAKTNNDESKTTQLTGTMASVLPQTGSNNDSTLAYAGLLLVSLMGLASHCTY